MTRMKRLIYGIVVAALLIVASAPTLLAQSSYTGCVWYYCITYFDPYAIPCDFWFYDLIALLGLSGVIGCV